MNGETSEQQKIRIFSECAYSLRSSIWRSYRCEAWVREDQELVKGGNSSKLNELGKEGYTSPLEPVNQNQASPAYRLSENSTGLRSHRIRLRRTIS